MMFQLTKVNTSIMMVSIGMTVMAMCYVPPTVLEVVAVVCIFWHGLNADMYNPSQTFIIPVMLLIFGLAVYFSVVAWFIFIAVWWAFFSYSRGRWHCHK